MAEPRKEKAGEEDTGLCAEEIARQQAWTESSAAEEAAEQEREKAADESLPPLSDAEFREYNSMAETMEFFHNRFRATWNLLYNACLTNKRPAHLTLKQFLNTGLEFCSHLATHHGIEEQHVFPHLAARMPEFAAGANAAELLRQHEAIHAGMDGFAEYLRACRAGETELELRVLKQKMDSWGEVLWKHLDQEVKTLAPANMRRYWSLEDMRRMPM